MMRSRWILGFLLLVVSACGGSSDGVRLDTTDPEGGRDAGGSGTGGPSGTGGDDNESGATSTGDGDPAQCGDHVCTAPAFCDENRSMPKCVCPEGYDDEAGDGSECTDIDECTDGGHDCGLDSTCENTEGGFECRCAESYTEVSGVCLKNNITTCDDGAECASGNCVGGVCCAEACDSPGQCQALGGTICLNGDTCQYGQLADDTDCSDLCTIGTCFDGECIVTEAKDCSDGDACTDDVCNPETGDCAQSASDCDDNNPCTSDACDVTTGCRHTNDDTATCSDGDECTTDVCGGGLCRSTQLNCSGLTDDCNEGVCVAGTCEAQPANQGGACADGLDACDTAGSCNGNGACVGDQDACGTLATACATCTGAGSCIHGRRCTCRESTDEEPPIVVDPQIAVCEFDNDECNADPCFPSATCNDPSPAAGNVVCTCPSGYSGTGQGANGCADIDECGQSPCGVGVATDGCNGTSPPGSYSCTCKAGYRAIATPSGPTCVCDMGGTYAMYTTSRVTYDPVLVGGIEVTEGSGGELDSYSWALRYHEVQSDGTMTVTTIPCGGSTPTVCSTLNTTGLAQYQDSKIWGKSTINDGVAPIDVSLVGVVEGAGDSYVEPQTIVTSGISLADPSGAWPPCAACINVPANQNTCTCADGQHDITNRAFWEDSDGNGAGSGISIYAVLAGGATIGEQAHDPPVNYSAESVCPRLAPGDPWPYASWPGLALGFFFTTEWDGASRVTSQVQSTRVRYSGGQCLIDGNITGPDGGRALNEGRVRSCRTCGSATCASGTANCNTAQRDFYDSVDPSQQIASAHFELNRVDTGQDAIDLGPILAMTNELDRASALNQACLRVRQRFCPAGETCAP